MTHQSQFLFLLRICCVSLLSALVICLPFAVNAEDAYAQTEPWNTSENDPLKRYLQAHESMSTADSMKESDLPEDAAILYQEALNIFTELLVQHPGWKTDLVNYRIDYCKKELARQQTVVSSPEMSLPKQDIQQRQSGALADARNTARLRQAAQLEHLTDLPAALALYQQILTEVPQHLAALQGAARIYLRLQRLEPAREILAQAAQLPQNDDDTLLLRAILLCHDGNFHGARRLLDAVLKRNPFNPHAHLIMGVVLADTGQLDEAEEATKRAISFNPKLGDAYYNLAQISLHQQPFNLEKTRLHYRNALKYGSKPDPALETLIK